MASTQIFRVRQTITEDQWIDMLLNIIKTKLYFINHSYVSMLRLPITLTPTQ